MAAIDEAGELLSNRKVPTYAEQLLRIFGEWDPSRLEVTFEATFGWGWFAELLDDAGLSNSPRRLATSGQTSATMVAALIKPMPGMGSSRRTRETTCGLALALAIRLGAHIPRQRAEDAQTGYRFGRHQGGFR